jgi:hypothetical protein
MDTSGGGEGACTILAICRKELLPPILVTITGLLLSDGSDSMAVFQASSKEDAPRTIPATLSPLATSPVSSVNTRPTSAGSTFHL